MLHEKNSCTSYKVNLPVGMPHKSHISSYIPFLRRNRDRKQELELDWSDKKEANEIDSFCGGLRNEHTNKQFFGGSAKFQEMWVALLFTITFIELSIDLFIIEHSQCSKFQPIFSAAADSKYVLQTDSVSQIVPWIGPAPPIHPASEISITFPPTPYQHIHPGMSQGNRDESPQGWSSHYVMPPVCLTWRGLWSVCWDAGGSGACVKYLWWINVVYKRCIVGSHNNPCFHKSL